LFKNGLKNTGILSLKTSEKYWQRKSQIEMTEQTNVTKEKIHYKLYTSSKDRRWISMDDEQETISHVGIRR
jgi:hypothetical protein